MDRLDAWLNAQRGWRRFALLCLIGWLVALTLGELVIASLNFTSPNPGPRSVLLLMVLSVPGAVPVTGLMMPLLLWSARRARKRGKPEKPLLDWRAFLGMLLFVGAQMISLLQITEPNRWNQAHLEVSMFLDVVSMVLVAASLFFMLWDSRYQRRITRANDPAPAAGANPYTWPW